MIDKAPRPEPIVEESLSSPFRKLIKHTDQLRWLLNGSDVSIPLFDSRQKMWEWWKKSRKPVAGIIDRLADPEKKKISVFDFGCANGFFLRSLQEWSSHDIEPYGFDLKLLRINAARLLFPNKKRQFTSNERDMQKFPPTFDFVYWNLWDNWDLKTNKQVRQLLEIYHRVAPGGYLIVGLYDHSTERRLAKLKWLAAIGFTPAGVEEGLQGQETFAWFKGPPKT